MFAFVVRLCVVLLVVSAAAVEPIAKQPVGVAESAPAGDDRSVETADGWMVVYEQTIPGTDIAFTMVPVPGGVVRLPVGTVDGEPAYCEVKIRPHWVGKCEVTWAEYREFMQLNTAYAELQQLGSLADGGKKLESSVALVTAATTDYEEDATNLGVDAVTAPTPLYDPSTTYESGDDPELPAVTMTPFAARQYTKWLSQLTGHTYRLPSEVEWLHAAAAGEPIDFDAEADPAAIDDVAWYTGNADYVAQPVGTKTPNAWGLHDTLGNAAELVLDASAPDGRPELADKQLGVFEVVAWPTGTDARIAKGGWYDAEAEEITLAHRMVTSDEDWKASDPNLPMSPWWYADYPATGVGFRVIRTLEPLPEEYRSRVWDTADVGVARAVNERLREGRGKLGPIGPELPAVLDELGSPAVQSLLK
ncbi:MAG: SUMF1/EgtB/PvdO family nonheme iron enzyme [Planctomycetota bacterium]